MWEEVILLVKCFFFSLIFVVLFFSGCVEQPMLLLKQDSNVFDLNAVGGDGEVQFNSGGVFGSDHNFQWDSVKDRLVLGDLNVSVVGEQVFFVKG